MTDPTAPTPPTGDPRQPAYDAVFAFIHGLGEEMPPTTVHRNAMLWRAVHAALDAMTTPVPSIHGTALRDRIANALIQWVYRGEDPEPGSTLEAVRANAYSRADAVLRVLTAPADRTGPQQAKADVLAAALDGLGRLIATSSRDWGIYRVDAWLWAVLVGWDCEKKHEHDDLCDNGGAMQEMAERHGWNADAVAKARRYRMSIRAATALSDGVMLPEPTDRAAVLREAADDLANVFGDPTTKDIGIISASYLRLCAREIEARQMGDDQPETQESGDREGSQ